MKREDDCQEEEKNQVPRPWRSYSCPLCQQDLEYDRDFGTISGAALFSSSSSPNSYSRSGRKQSSPLPSTPASSLLLNLAPETRAAATIEANSFPLITDTSSTFLPAIPPPTTDTAEPPPDHETLHLPITSSSSSSLVVGPPRLPRWPVSCSYCPYTVCYPCAQARLWGTGRNPRPNRGASRKNKQQQQHRRHSSRRSSRASSQEEVDPVDPSQVAVEPPVVWDPKRPPGATAVAAEPEDDTPPAWPCPKCQKKQAVLVVDIQQVNHFAMQCLSHMGTHRPPTDTARGSTGHLTGPPEKREESAVTSSPAAPPTLAPEPTDPLSRTRMTDITGIPEEEVPMETEAATVVVVPGTIHQPVDLTEDTTATKEETAATNEETTVFQTETTSPIMPQDTVNDPATTETTAAAMTTTTTTTSATASWDPSLLRDEVTTFAMAASASLTPGPSSSRNLRRTRSSDHEAEMKVDPENAPHWGDATMEGSQEPWPPRLKRIKPNSACILEIDDLVDPLVIQDDDEPNPVEPNHGPEPSSPGKDSRRPIHEMKRFGLRTVYFDVEETLSPAVCTAPQADAHDHVPELFENPLLQLPTTYPGAERVPAVDHPTGPMPLVSVIGGSYEVPLQHVSVPASARGTGWEGLQRYVHPAFVPRRLLDILLLVNFFFDDDNNNNNEQRASLGAVAPTLHDNKSLLEPVHPGQEVPEPEMDHILNADHSHQGTGVQPSSAGDGNPELCLQLPAADLMMPAAAVTRNDVGDMHDKNERGEAAHVRGDLEESMPRPLAANLKANVELSSEEKAKYANNFNWFTKEYSCDAGQEERLLTFVKTIMGFYQGHLGGQSATLYSQKPVVLESRPLDPGKPSSPQRPPPRLSTKRSVMTPPPRNQVDSLARSPRTGGRARLQPSGGVPVETNAAHHDEGDLNKAWEKFEKGYRVCDLPYQLKDVLRLMDNLFEDDRTDFYMSSWWFSEDDGVPGAKIRAKLDHILATDPDCPGIRWHLLKKKSKLAQVSKADFRKFMKLIMSLDVDEDLSGNLLNASKTLVRTEPRRTSERRHQRTANETFAAGLEGVERQNAQKDSREKKIAKRKCLHGKRSQETLSLESSLATGCAEKGWNGFWSLVNGGWRPELSQEIIDGLDLLFSPRKFPRRQGPYFKKFWLSKPEDPGTYFRQSLGKFRRKNPNHPGVYWRSMTKFWVPPTAKDLEAFMKVLIQLGELAESEEGAKQKGCAVIENIDELGKDQEVSNVGLQAELGREHVMPQDEAHDLALDGHWPGSFVSQKEPSEADGTVEGGDVPITVDGDASEVLGEGHSRQYTQFPHVAKKKCRSASGKKTEREEAAANKLDLDSSEAMNCARKGWRGFEMLVCEGERLPSSLSEILDMMDLLFSPDTLPRGSGPYFTQFWLKSPGNPGNILRQKLRTLLTNDPSSPAVAWKQEGKNWVPSTKRDLEEFIKLLREIGPSLPYVEEVDDYDADEEVLSLRGWDWFDSSRTDDKLPTTLPGLLDLMDRLFVSKGCSSIHLHQFPEASLNLEKDASSPSELTVDQTLVEELGVAVVETHLALPSSTSNKTIFGDLGGCMYMPESFVHHDSGCEQAGAPSTVESSKPEFSYLKLLYLEAGNGRTLRWLRQKQQEEPDHAGLRWHARYEPWTPMTKSDLRAFMEILHAMAMEIDQQGWASQPDRVDFSSGW